MDLPDQAAPTLDLAGELFDELRVAGAALGAHGLLLVLGPPQSNAELVAQVQGHGFDEHSLVALQTVELA